MHDIKNAICCDVKKQKSLGCNVCVISQNYGMPGVLKFEQNPSKTVGIIC